MSDEKQNENGESQQEIDVQEDHKSDDPIDKSKEEIKKLANKNRRLKDEIMKLKSEQDKILQAFESEKKQKAEEEGDYKSLYEAMMKENEKIKSDADLLKETFKKDKEESLISSALAEVATLFGEKAKPFKDGLRKRLKVVDIETGPQVAVLDENGDVTSMSLDDFKKDLKSSPDYSDFIVASNASGGGARGSKAKGISDNYSNLSSEQKIREGLKMNQ